MFSNFTDEAIKVLQLAQQATIESGHAVIGTEHLLLGILSNDTCRPSRILKSMGITLKKAEGEVFRIMGRGDDSVYPDLNFTPRAKALLKMACDHRDLGNRDQVDAEDLMNAMIRIPRCTGQKVLHALDIDTDVLVSRLQRPFNDSHLAPVTTGNLRELHKKIQSGLLDRDSDASSSDSDFDEQPQSPEESGPDGFDGDTTYDVPIPDKMLGQIIDGRYEVLSVIGHGGMGVVYRVRHLVLQRDFAIKVLHPYLAHDQKNRRRFQREAQAASQLTHPNLATVFDWSLMEDGRPYIVMYYIEGVKLNELIKARRSIGLSTWVSVFMQICDALAHAHNQGVLHRDLKPGNIILSRDGETSHFVKIVDFGIAKFLKETNLESRELTETGEVFGSPLYMSPEQCLGTVNDVRTDIYSLGIVMYECLTGNCPFWGDSLFATMKMQVSAKPLSFRAADPDSNCPQLLEKIVMKCLAKDPDRRFQTMKSLNRELAVVLTNLIE